MLTGSFGGNQLLTIAGSGFSNNASVQICNSECKVLNSSYNQIICQTPSSESDDHGNDNTN